MNGPHFSEDILRQYAAQLEKLERRVSHTFSQFGPAGTSIGKFCHDIQVKDGNDEAPSTWMRRDTERGLSEQELYLRYLATTYTRIQLALGRIEERTYGRCLKCHGVINGERLQNLPYAEYCYKCQQQYEYTYESTYRKE